MLTTDAVRELAGDEGFSWTEAGRKRIKGLKEPIPVWRCRPARDRVERGEHRSRERAHARVGHHRVEGPQRRVLHRQDRHAVQLLRDEAAA